MYIRTWKRLAPVQGVISGTIQCRRNYISYTQHKTSVRHYRCALYKAIIPVRRLFVKYTEKSSVEGERNGRENCV